MISQSEALSEGYEKSKHKVIPSEWNTLELSQVANRITRKNKGTISQNVLTISAQHGLVSQTDFFNKKVASKNLENYYLLEKDDFAYNKSYSNGYPMGTIKPLELYDMGIVSSLYICFKLDPTIANTEFMRHYFATNLWHNEVAKIAKEGARNHGLLNVSVKEFFNIKLTLPPLEEQRKIAEIVGSFEKQIKDISRLIIETKKLKKGVAQKLLTEGIGHSSFKESELCSVPKQWELVKLEDISDFITKGTTPTTYGHQWQESGILFFKSDVVKEGRFVPNEVKFISEEAHFQMSRSKIISGDILITITGNIGRVAMVPQEIKEANINQHIARIRIIHNSVNPLFVYHWLNQNKIINYYQSIKTGLAYSQISLKQVRETVIPLPSMEEQEKIIKVLSSLDEQIKRYEEERAQYVKLKKTLTRELLTGELRVTV
jgi:type I restriction enzyme S subunit